MQKGVLDDYIAKHVASPYCSKDICTGVCNNVFRILACL